jgi:hypothetical protein
MTHYDFYNFVLKHWFHYLVAFTICAVFFFIVGRKYTHTWFDPLRIQMVISTFTSTVFVFLYISGLIKLNVFIYLCIAVILFWSAFIFAAKKTISFSKKKLANEASISFVLYLIFLVLFVFIMILTYVLFGIPIFRGNRLETYVGSGFGVLGRMLPFLKIYCIFYSFYLWEKSTRLSFERLLVIIVFLIFIVTGILSGSRSSFFIFVYIYWGFSYIYRRNIQKVTKYYNVLILGLGITILTFSIQSGSTNLAGSFRPFVERVVASGDAYFMALPKDNWMHVNIDEWYKHLFYGLIGPTRIMSGYKYIPVGFQLYGLVYPSSVEPSSGPLSDPALLSFIYFRWGGLVFMLLLGFFVSLVIFQMPSLLPRGIISSIVYLYILLQFLNFIGDPCLGMAYLFDTILNITFLLIIMLITYSIYGRVHKKSLNHNVSG